MSSKTIKKQGTFLSVPGLLGKYAFATVAFPGPFLITALFFVFQVMGQNDTDQFKRP